MNVRRERMQPIKILRDAGDRRKYKQQNENPILSCAWSFLSCPFVRHDPYFLHLFSRVGVGLPWSNFHRPRPGLRCSITKTPSWFALWQIKSLECADLSALWSYRFAPPVPLQSTSTYAHNN